MDLVSEPELIEDGRPDGRSLVVPPIVWRVVVAGAAIFAVAFGVVSFRGSSTTPPRPSPTASSLIAPPTSQADVVVLLARSKRRDLIRDVPAAYRDAARRASAMRDGRTPGNFFLAIGYERTWYGKWLSGSGGQWYGPRGPVQWESAEFQRYADPRHGDINAALDSFLAVDTALHAGGSPDFSAGAYGPAKLLGMPTSEALAIANIYDTLANSTVGEGTTRR
jgi:hypothetical protein